jgi:hypothetical protein
VLLSIIFIIPLSVHHEIFFSDDLVYHIIRIKELTDNVTNNNFYPYLYTYNYGRTAFLLGAFYSQIMLYPFTFFVIFLKSIVKGIYCGIAFYTLLTLCFTYLAMRKIGKNRINAYVVALVYGFCTYRTIDGFTRFALGEYLAMVFIPLAFYGVYAILFGKKKDWPYLALGLSFIFLSHILSTFISVIIMALLFLVAFPKMKERFARIKTLIYAVVVFILSSAIFLFPLIEQIMFQKYGQPSPQNLFENAPSFGQLVQNSLSNDMTRAVDGNVYNIGLLLLISIIWGAFNFKKLQWSSKVSLIIGSILFISASTIIPWNILMQTPIKVIQFPFRILAFSSFFLSVVAGDMIISLGSDFEKNKNKKNIRIIVLSFLMVLIPWYSGLHSFAISHGANMADAYFEGKQYNNRYYAYLSQYNTKKVVKHLQDIFQHRAVVNGKKVSLKQISALPDGMKYSDKVLMNKSSIELPISYYKNLRVFEGNKRLTTFMGKRGMLGVKNINKAPITVKYVPSALNKFSQFLSITTWVLVASACVLKRLLYLLPFRLKKGFK